MKNISIIPEQKRGSKVTCTKCVMSDSQKAAEDLFVKTKNKLLDVNDWNELGVGSYFCLYNDKATQKIGLAEIGNFIRIGLPVPGTVEGDGFDWVRIERLENFTGEDWEYIGMRVKPSQNPCKDTAEIAHFFKDTATSTYIIERVGADVTASYYGRNEAPNIKEVSKMSDKLRNIVVAIGGLLGFSKIHWKVFIENIIDENYKKELAHS